MPKYEVFKLRGDYDAREDEANRRDLDLVVHFHFNSGPRTARGSLVLYARPVVGREAAIAKRFADGIAKLIGAGNRGAQLLADGARGEFIIDENGQPALILEPDFVSNPSFAAWIKKDANRKKLARLYADIIRSEFPNGGKIGLSLGHKYKTSNPSDRGVDVYGGGTEAQYAERVLVLTARELGRTLTASPKPVMATRKVIARGAYNSWVGKIQRRLAERGFYHGRVDNDFGPMTEAAVRTFQRAKHLNADGKVSADDFAALGL